MVTVERTEELDTDAFRGDARLDNTDTDEDCSDRHHPLANFTQNSQVQAPCTLSVMETTIEDIVRVAAPRPLLSRTAEARLGARHREVLDQLDKLFMANGFAAFTIADVAREIGCSRRTLYEIAPSKDQLVLVVLDRHLHTMGRAALDSIDREAALIDQVRQYIQGGLEYQMFAPMLDDLADDAPARRLIDRHYRFVMSVVQQLVALGVERGEFADVEPAIVGAVVTGSSLYLMQSDIEQDSGLPMATLVSGMLDLVLGSLPVGSGSGPVGSGSGPVGGEL